MASASAVTQTYVEPGIVENLGVGADLLDREFDLLVNRFNKVPLQGSPLFKTVSAVKDTYKHGSVSNSVEQPRENMDSDDLPWVTPAPGYDKSFTIVNYRSGIRVTRQMVEDQIHGKVRYMMSGLVDSARRRIEYGMAGVFNNAFATTVNGDNMYLCDTVHPNEARESGTWTNLETAGALMHTSYSTARVNLRKRRNERGEVMGLNPTVLVVTPDDEETAKRIFNSEKISGGALNDENPWKGEVQLKVYDYLSSTTAWFLFGDIPKEFCGLLYVQRVAPNVAPWPASNTDVLMAKRLRMRYAVGFNTERNLQGNAGA